MSESSKVDFVTWHERWTNGKERSFRWSDNGCSKENWTSSAQIDEKTAFDLSGVWVYFFLQFHCMNFELCFRKYKNRTRDPELIKLHKKFNHVDYLLYEHFNATLWKQIEQEGQDFWEELQVFHQYQKRARNYCEPIYQQMKRNRNAIFKLYKTKKPMRLPKSRWGPALVIGPVWCLVSRIDTTPLHTILRVKMCPQICYHAVPPGKYNFWLRNEDHAVQIAPKYCAENKEKTLVPLKLLATKQLKFYMWT